MCVINGELVGVVWERAPAGWPRGGAREGWQARRRGQLRACGVRGATRRGAAAGGAAARPGPGKAQAGEKQDWKPSTHARDAGWWRNYPWGDMNGTKRSCRMRKVWTCAYVYVYLQYICI